MRASFGAAVRCMQHFGGHSTLFVPARAHHELSVHIVSQLSAYAADSCCVVLKAQMKTTWVNQDHRFVL
jgi:hypothetical protein